MNISSFPMIKYYSNNYNNVSFKTNHRIVCDKYDQFVNCNTTCFFRDDLHWGNLPEVIKLIFKNANNIHFYDFGCSDGSEAFSYSMMVLEELKEYISNIGTIQAFDIDKEIIQKANSGNVAVSNIDIKKLKFFLGDKFDQYVRVEPFKHSYTELYGIAQPADIVKKMIHFEQGDILDKIDNLSSENNIVSCRNFWCYLRGVKREELKKKLAQKLTGTNIVLIGYVDRDCGIDKYLKQNGFKEIDLNVFVKINKERFQKG